MLIRSYRVRGHLEARLDPLGLQIPATHRELDPHPTASPTPTSIRPIFIDNVLGRETRDTAGNHPHLPRHLLRLDRRRVMHIQDPDQKSWIQRRSRARHGSARSMPPGKRRSSSN